MSIIWSAASWRYIVDKQTQMHVPVARTSREQSWRRVCTMSTDDHANEEVEDSLCSDFVRQQLMLASMNVTYTEAWLTRGRVGQQMFFSNIAQGNCSQYSRTLLVLPVCRQKGMNIGTL